MQDFTTPMMKQYMEIKNQFQDCLLFYRMGDFYELFLEDAYIGAKVLDIVLTSRSKGKDGRIPMAGVPYHAVDSYLSKLVKAGYKVAICEQVSEPSSRGIVDREVIRIVTPGTVLDDQSLIEKEHNFIISVFQEHQKFGLAIADLSTGLFEMEELDTPEQLIDEIKRLGPTEIILAPKDYNNRDTLRLVQNYRGKNISCFQNADYFLKQSDTELGRQFGKQALIDEVKKLKMARIASSLLLGYLKYTQTDRVSHFKNLNIVNKDRLMQLDFATITNLELFSTLRTKESNGTLLQHLDHTKTAMGGRLLRSWLKRPLLAQESINIRQECVGYLLNETELHNEISKEMEHIGDIERLLSRLTLGIGNAKDLVILSNALKRIIKLKSLLPEDITLFKEFSLHVDASLNQIIRNITDLIIDNPPFSTKEGGLIRDGVDTKLDTLRQIVNGNSSWLAELEKKERERTNISNLKVRYNKVHGFYIEVSNSNKEAVPSNYMRKQTLVNGERYITYELKEKEEFILTSEKEIEEYEYKLYIVLLEKVLIQTTLIQEAAQQIAILDCISAFVIVSEKYHYVRPKEGNEEEIIIKEGRHPVVETMMGDDLFVPNDTHLDTESQQLHIITGPNMAGKSVYIRQVALIVLLNQIGCFVPASQATLPLVDRIFVRSGASDMISEGLSTFMVEMVETAQILNKASSQSLVVMDEIGRGTSTYDGISIAWAVAEYMVTNNSAKPKTLFATHYHELQELPLRHPTRIKNYHMAVEDEDGTPVFLYTLLPEGASHSYGIAVARLAGLPDKLIKNAYNVLQTLEKKENIDGVEDIQDKQSFQRGTPSALIKRLQQLDIEQMTPLEALTTLALLKEESLT